MVMLHDKNPYEDLRLPESTIQEIIEIYESFSDIQKKILTFYILVDDNVTMMARYFHYDELFVMETLQQSLAAFPAIHLLELRQVLRIYLQSRDDLPMILDDDGKNENFFVYQWKQFRGFVYRLHPIERVVIGICAMAFFYASATTGTALYQFGLVKIEHKKNADMYMNPSEDAPLLEVVENLYLPEYLPEGYKLGEQDGTPYESDFILTIYTNGTDEIFFYQYISTMNIDLDNENISSKKVTIDNNEGIYREDSQEKVLIWPEQNYFYLLKTENSTMKENELLKIASSLKEISNEKN